MTHIMDFSGNSPHERLIRAAYSDQYYHVGSSSDVFDVDKIIRDCLLKLKDHPAPTEHQAWWIILDYIHARDPNIDVEHMPPEPQTVMVAIPASDIARKNWGALSGWMQSFKEKMVVQISELTSQTLPASQVISRMEQLAIDAQTAFSDAMERARRAMDVPAIGTLTNEKKVLASALNDFEPRIVTVNHVTEKGNKSIPATKAATTVGETRQPPLHMTRKHLINDFDAISATDRRKSSRTHIHATTQHDEPRHHRRTALNDMSPFDLRSVFGFDISST
jgi:hypothetical protein